LYGAVVGPLATHAQQPERIPRIGVLFLAARENSLSFVHAFTTGMAERGYQDGKKIQAQSEA
jgi:hypothetical protein